MARRATIILDAKTGDARSNVQQLENALADMGDRADFIGQDFSDLEDKASRNLIDLRTQLQRTDTATRSMGRGASTTATQLGFELTQAAQDAQFGMAGVANQIPLVAEQFQRLQSQSGSTTGAMRALMSTFLGPTGLIALGTLLPTLLPKVLSFFEETEAAAKEAGEAYKDAADAFFSLQELELPEEQTAAVLRRQQERVDAAITNLEARRRELQRTAPGPGGGGTVVGPDARELDRINNRLERFRVIQTKINDALKQRRQQLQLVRDAQGDLLRQVEQVEPENQIIDFGDAALDASLQFDGLIARLQSAENKTEDLRAAVLDLGTGFGQAAFRQERFNQALQNIIARAERTARQRRRGVREVATRTGRLPAAGTTSGIQRTLQGQQGALARGSRELAKNFERVEQAASNTEGSTQAAAVAVDVMSGAAVNFASSIIQGKSAAEVLPSIFDEVARQLTRIAVRKGIIAVLNAISGGIAGATSSGAQAFTSVVDPGISGAEILSGAQHGGIGVGGPMRLHPPELITNVPSGAQIVGREETMEILGQSTGQDRVVQELRAMRQEMRSMEVRIDAFRANADIGSAQRRLENAGDRIYPAQ